MNNTRIRVIRNSKKLSGVEIAKKLGMSPQHYYDIEKGNNGLSAENAVKLADIFEVPLDYLLGQSVGALIEESLKRTGLSMEELAKRARVSTAFLQKIDSIMPDEGDYEALDRVAAVLSIEAKDLRAALSKQEPPVYDEAVIDVKEVIESEAEILFNGVPLTKEEREKVLTVLGAMLGR